MINQNGFLRRFEEMQKKMFDDVAALIHDGVAQEGGQMVRPPVLKVAGFQLGAKSKEKQQLLRPEMVSVSSLAIQLTTQDFTIFETLRTLERQQKMFAEGTSRTMESKHLIQPGGWSDAMDLVPWVNGKAVWDWNRIYPIAFAVDQAATTLGFAKNIRWGGAWDRRLSDFGGSLKLYEKECEAYAARHPGKDFLDGPHFEWVK